MTTRRREFSATDANPTVLYGKTDRDDVFSYPLLIDSAGRLILSSLVPAEYDFIQLDPPNQPTTITYKLGGSAGVTVATLTLTYSGSDVATVTRT